MNPPTFATRRSLALTACIGVVLLAVAACGESTSGRTSAAPSPLDSVVPAQPSEIPDLRPSVQTLLPAPPVDPTETIRQYVAAEIAGDSARSYTLLSDAARDTAGSQADWIAGSFRRPAIVAADLDAATERGSTRRSIATVTGTITFEPRLDEVSGFVPAHADVAWQLVAEDGGWRIDIANSTVHPLLPDEADAAIAAATWARDRQRCSDAGEYAGSLLGSPVLAEQLCDVDGEFVAGPPGRLGDTLATQMVAAFGPDAATWARTVALSGAADLTVVTAPLGDRWVVVGVTG
jgi:hypothetical protein